MISTGLEPKMWGTSIVGFGIYHYKYESGHEGNAPLVGISSRANAITLYLSSNFKNKEELLSKFGKHKKGKGCIYIKKLEDIDIVVLKQMVENSIEEIQTRYPNKMKKLKRIIGFSNIHRIIATASNSGSSQITGFTTKK